MTDIDDILRRHLADPRSSWAVGTFGAIAEFHWVDGDAVQVEESGGLVAASDRGALRLEWAEPVRPLAYETLSGHRDRWLHGLLFCVPAGEARGRAVLTELGRDEAAVREADRDAVLLDIGLGAANVEACVRTRDPALLAVLRRAAGRSVLEPGSPAMGAIKAASPHRVFRSRLGRAEVYQRIGSSSRHVPTPEGPHTHVLPRLLAAGRTHAATIPVPHRWWPAVQLFPPNPVSDDHGEARPYDREDHRQFDRLLQAFGDPDFVREKARAGEAIDSRVDPERYPAPASRVERTALRIAIRQRGRAGTDPAVVERWRARFDVANAREPDPLVH